MQPIENVLKHIDVRLTWYMERPKMYSLDAYALEGLFLTLEELREFILRDAPIEGPLAPCGFVRYISTIRRDLNGDSVVGRECKRLRVEATDDRVYKALIDSWRDYLNSSYRLPLDNRELDAGDNTQL
jgi:hypothetical protein